MTTTIAIDTATGGPAWPFTPVSGVAAVSKMLIRLRTELGEVPADASIGLPLQRWLTPPRPTAEEVEVLVRLQVEAVDGVTVTSVSATVGQTIAVAVQFVYTEPDGGAFDVTLTAPLYAAEGLPAWYARPCGC